MCYAPALDTLLSTSLPSVFECGLVGEEDDDLKLVMLVVEGHAVAGGGGCLQRCAPAVTLAMQRTLCQVAPCAPTPLSPASLLLTLASLSLSLCQVAPRLVVRYYLFCRPH